MAYKGNKKRYDEDYKSSEEKADDTYRKTHSKLAKETELGWAPDENPPYEYDEKDAEKGSKDSGTVSDFSRRAGSKSMKNDNIYNMEKDLSEQKKYEKEKDDGKFSKLKKMLRGEK